MAGPQTASLRYIVALGVAGRPVRRRACRGIGWRRGAGAVKLQVACVDRTTGGSGGEKFDLIRSIAPLICENWSPPVRFRPLSVYNATL